MILYNIILGNLNLTPDAWTHIEDQHGNHFIAKDDIRQRIRIDGKIDSSIYPALGELTPTWSAANMQCYHILPGTRWVNNNRNMNPLLLNQKEGNEGKEQIVVYITVSNNYAIARFNTTHKILQTYHKKDMLQGCAVVLDSDALDEDNRIISINVYDKKKDQYSQFRLSFMKEDLEKIKIDRKAITDKTLLNQMKDQVRKFNSRYMGFKILTKPNELLTVTYVTSDKFKSDIEKITKDINNPKIIIINPDMLDNTQYLNEVTDMLTQEFEEGRIRAITQCGVNLPLDVIKQLKLLYVFNYDIKNNILSCRKSN